MKIRPFLASDFNDVCELLKSKGIGAPKELSDMGGICLVADKDGELIGCVWALVGNSTQAYIGYWATKNVFTGYKLLEHLDTVLRLHGIKRYRFVTNKSNQTFMPIAKKLGVYHDAVSVWREL